MKRELSTLLFFVFCGTILIAQSPTAIVKKALIEPIVDGVVDEVWETANAYKIDQPFRTDTATLGESGSTTWMALWTNEGIYLLIQVNDDIFFPAFLGLYPGEVWNYDKPELFFDVNPVLKDGFGPPNDRSGADNGHFMITPSFEVEKIKGQAVTDYYGVINAFRVTDPTYVAEYFVPFKKLIDRKGHMVNRIATFGFDVTIIDRDSEVDPRQKVSWSNKGAIDESFYNMDDCGTFTLEDSEPDVYVNAISVSSVNGKDTIDFDGGSMQMKAEILPSDATFKDIKWTVADGSGKAYITDEGVLLAKFDGMVTVTASSTDGSGITGSKEITIINQFYTLREFNILRDPDFSNGGTPDSPWRYVSSNSGSASGGNGMCAMIRTMDNEPWWAEIKQSDLAVYNDSSYILTFTAESYSSNKYFFIDIEDDVNHGSMLIGSSADAESNGRSHWQVPITDMKRNFTFHITVDQLKEGSISELRFSAPDSTETVFISEISLVNVNDLKKLGIPVSSINVTSEGNVSVIADNKGTLQLYAEVLPKNATFKDITWDFYYGAEYGTLTSDGLFTASRNGEVAVKATSKDGQNTEGIFQISVYYQTLVSAINIFSERVVPTIETNNGSLQLIAEILPEDAAWKNITWSVVNGTGKATISYDGLLTALTNGTVTAKAISTDGGDVVGSLVITISNQTPVSSIIVRGANNATSITSNHSYADIQLQMSAEVLPADAPDKNFRWSVENGTGSAYIDENGLLLAITEGTVTVKATSLDGQNIVGSQVITIAYGVHLYSIAINAEGGATKINKLGGNLQMYAEVLPANATNKVITWMVFSHGGRATISADGLLTAEKFGDVIVIAASQDSMDVVGIITITISDQIAVESLTLSGAGGASSIETENGTLQMYAEILPLDATIQQLVWSVANGTGEAIINSYGLLIAVNDGIVTVYACTTDGSNIQDSLTITISNQVGVKDNILRTVKVYPNPVVNELMISTNILNSKVAIYTINGHKLDEFIAKENLVRLNTSSLPAGIYFVKINGVVCKKFIK